MWTLTALIRANLQDLMRGRVAGRAAQPI